MASLRNDLLAARSGGAAVNLYDDQRCIGTCKHKAIAARMGGHAYDIVNHKDAVYFPNLRHDDHFVDREGNTTKYFFDMKKKFPMDPRNMVQFSLTHPADHAKEEQYLERRMENQILHASCPQVGGGKNREISGEEAEKSFPDYQRKRAQFRNPTPRMRKSIDRKKWDYQGALCQPSAVSKEEFLQTKSEIENYLSDKGKQSGRGAGGGEGTGRSLRSRSTASLDTPSREKRQKLKSLVYDIPERCPRPLGMQTRDEGAAHQLLADSAKYCLVSSAGTQAMSVSNCPEGRERHNKRVLHSIRRLDNFNFDISKGNNHFSGYDHLTRLDPYYACPRLDFKNSSVKYNIVNNQKMDFYY